MISQVTQKELRQQAVRALTENLGPVQALRFLALVSREPFDYQEWRRQYFSQYGVDELLIEVRNTAVTRDPDTTPNVANRHSVIFRF